MTENIYVEAADRHHFQVYLNQLEDPVESVELRLANAYERVDGNDAMKINLIINGSSTPIGVGEIVMGMIEFVERVEIGCKSCPAVPVSKAVKTIIEGVIGLPTRF